MDYTVSPDSLPSGSETEKLLSVMHCCFWRGIFRRLWNELYRRTKSYFRQKEKLPTFWSGAFYPALSYFCLAAIFGVRELNFWVKLRHDFECPVHTIRFFYALYIGAGYHLSSIRLAYVCPKSAPICAPTFILPVPGIGIILHFWTDTAIRERSSGFETGNWSFPEDGEIPRL